MKHIMLLIAVAFTFAANAQSTYTRPQAFGTYDASSISYKYQTLSDATGTDTINFRPNAQTNYYTLSVADSVNVNLKSTAGCYKGDIFKLYITKATGAGAMTLLGNFVVSTGTSRIALTASKKGLIIFEFDGVSFVEVSRNLNY